MSRLLHRFLLVASIAASLLMVTVAASLGWSSLKPIVWGGKLSDPEGLFVASFLASYAASVWASARPTAGRWLRAINLALAIILGVCSVFLIVVTVKVLATIPDDAPPMCGTAASILIGGGLLGAAALAAVLVSEFYCMTRWGMR